MKEFTWAIIGTGRAAHWLMNDLQFSSATPVIKAVVAKEMTEGKQFANQYHILACYDNLDEMFEKTKVDAAYIATPHSLHFTQSMKCLEHHVAVLCEKPLAMNACEVEALTAKSINCGTFLMEAMWLRFLPGIKQVLNKISEGIIGEIISVSANICYKEPEDKNNRFFNPQLGGGSLLDLGVYGIFLSSWILGKSKMIRAMAILNEKNIDESCIALLQYAGGQYAIVESSFVKDAYNEAVIYGEKGFIKIHHPWNERPEKTELVVNGQSSYLDNNKCEGRGMYYQVEEVQHCLLQQETESSILPLSLSSDIAQTMDDIRKQAGIQYEQDGECEEIK